MANEKNLIPAKKGEVRNPKGRGKGRKDNATILREVLKARKEPIEGDDPRYWLFNRLCDAIENGKPSEAISAIKEQWDRIDGKAVAKVEDITPAKPTPLNMDIPVEDASKPK